MKRIKQTLFFQYKPALLFLLIFFLFSESSAKSQPFTKGAVVSEQHLASEIGLQVLKKGGNAIDAAVAVAYALAVVNPCCGNLGGGGFMTIHLASGEDIFINFRERAPLAANEKIFLDEKGNVIPGKSLWTYSAVATPGTVMGLETALQKYGTQKRADLIAPAIRLAKEGFILQAGDIKLLDEHVDDFQKDRKLSEIYLNHGNPYQIGDRLIQKDLGQSLESIAEKGAAGFYEGKIPEAIVKDSQLHGGLLSLKDFSSYRVEISKPISCTYRGYTILSAAPPSSGGMTLCETLNILEKYPLNQYGFHSRKSLHFTIEALRRAFYDRNNQIGDPDFIHIPIKKLLSKSYAATLRENILEEKASPYPLRNPIKEGMQTTHFSVMDRDGNVVSMTYTLNSFFGARLIAGHTGILLNNSMDDFSAKANIENQFHLIEGSNNLVEPGKRPLSSMTPTIVLKDKNPILVLGSPGGPRIITATLEALMNVLDFHMRLQEAVNAKRFHHQYSPDLVYLEPETLNPLIRNQLVQDGYIFQDDKGWGAVEAIYRDPKTHRLETANDLRRPAGLGLQY